MDAQPSRYHSKRAQQIVVETQDGDQAASAIESLTTAKVQKIKAVRDQFDSDSPQVGLRDSTWLIVSFVALAAIAATWGEPKGVDLFARLLVVGGGVTIAAAVACRNFLARS